MTPGLVLAIAGAIVALAIGIWAGLPGKPRKTPEEIERDIQRAILTGVTPRAARRVPTTPFGWLRRKSGQGSSSVSQKRFHVDAPDERERKRPGDRRPPDRPSA